MLGATYELIKVMLILLILYSLWGSCLTGWRQVRLRDGAPLFLLRFRIGGHDFRSVARLVNFFRDRSRGQHLYLIMIRIFVRSSPDSRSVEELQIV
jgi:hypothetical protein